MAVEEVGGVWTKVFVCQNCNWAGGLSACHREVLDVSDSLFSLGYLCPRCHCLIFMPEAAEREALARLEALRGERSEGEV